MKRKSILKALLLTVLMCCLTFALVACGGKHTVTFNYGVDGNGDGEVDVVTVEVGDGSLLEEPTDVPTREGYTFVGWGTDDGMWNFEEDTVTSDLTLTARWSAGDPIDPGTPGTTVYVNYKLGVGAADSDSDSDSDPSFVPNRWSGAPGTTIKLPPAPAAAAGWEFTGWLVTGETELREEGSDYTVTGTVTITAQWKSFTKISPVWNTEGLISDQGEVLKDLVGTYTPTGGGDVITVTIAKDVLSAAMQTFFENAEEEGGMATTPETGAIHAVEEASGCLTEGKGTLYYTVYYQVPETSLYVEESVAVFTSAIPAQGHFCTNWNVTVAPTEESTGTAQSVCTTCGNTVSVTLPKFTETNVVTEETELAEGYYFKETKRELTCEQDGIVDYQYMFTSSDLTNAKVSTSDSTENTVSFTVTTPATGHNYPETATWQADKFVVNCNNNCGKNYTLTITFAPGDDGTGDAPEMSSMTVLFDEKAMTFSFKTPASCPFTAPENQFFDGWSDGENTYGNSAKVTVPATAEARITLTAQWTTEHTHQYGAPTFDYLTGKVLRQCTLCSSGEGRTLSYDIDSLEVDSATKPDSLVVTDTDVDAVLTDLPDTLKVLARGDWESEDTTDVVIPHEYLKATITDNAYKNSTISIALNVTDPTSETAATITGVTLYKETKAAGSQSNYAIESLGDFTGEFEMQFSLTNIVPSSKNWESWIIIFESNELEARLRVDNYLQYNFGRAEGQFTADNTPGASVQLSGFNNNNVDFWSELKTMTAVDFTITRTYSSDDGVYTLVVVAKEHDGDAVATYTIVEPETTGNRITVSLSADGANTSFTRSSTVAADEQLAMTGIEADDVSVAYGTELNNVSLPVYGVYGSRAVKDLIASGYSVSAGESGYNAQVAAVYKNVEVTYNGYKTHIEVTVQAEVTHNWVNGVCTEHGEVCTHDVTGNVCTICGANFTSTDSSVTGGVFNWGTPSETEDVLIVEGFTTTLMFQYSDYTSKEWEQSIFTIQLLDDEDAWRYILRYTDGAFQGDTSSEVWNHAHAGETCVPSGDMTNTNPAIAERPNSRVKLVATLVDGTMTITVTAHAADDATCATALATRTFTLTGMTDGAYLLGFGCEAPATYNGQISVNAPVASWNSAE